MALVPMLLIFCYLLLSIVLSSIVHPANAVHLPPYDEPNIAFTKGTDRIVLGRAADDKTKDEIETPVPTTLKKKKPQVVRLGIKHEEHYPGLGFIPSTSQEDSQQKVSITGEKPSILYSCLERPDIQTSYSRPGDKDQMGVGPLVYANDPILRQPCLPVAYRESCPDCGVSRDMSVRYRQRPPRQEHSPRRKDLAVRQQFREPLYFAGPSNSIYGDHKSGKQIQEREYSYPRSYYDLPTSHQEPVITTKPYYDQPEDDYQSSNAGDGYPAQQPRDDAAYASLDHSRTSEEQVHRVYSEPHYTVQESQQGEHSLQSLPHLRCDFIQEAVCSCISYGDTGGECICPGTKPIMYSLASQCYESGKTPTDMFREEHFDRRLNKRDLWDRSLPNMDFLPEGAHLLKVGHQQYPSHKRGVESLVSRKSRESKTEGRKNRFTPDNKLGKSTMGTRNGYRSHELPHDR